MTAPSGEPTACITCGDAGTELVVVRIDGSDALCEAPDGTRQRVAVDFVDRLQAGDRVLVHASTALTKVSPP